MVVTLQNTVGIAGLRLQASVQLCPSSISLSSLTYLPPTPVANYAIANITSTDPNVGDTATYTVLPGLNSTLFTIINSHQLALVHAGQTGCNMQVQLNANDTTGLSYQQAFIINEGYSFFRSFVFFFNLIPVSLSLL